MTTLKAYAFGKIMVAGEYAVLFGKEALVLATRKAFCTYSSGSSFSFFTKTYAEVRRIDRHPLFLHAKNACKEAGIVAQKGEYLVDTTAFFDEVRKEKLGFGSSAAAMVALCKVIAQQQGEVTPKLAFELAYKAHRSFSSGLGSGADVAAAAFGEPISYALGSNGPVIHPVDLNLLTEHLVLIDIGKMQRTKPFIQKMTAFKEKMPDYFNSFNEQSEILCKKIKNGKNITSLIDAFNQYFILLKNLSFEAGMSIVTKQHKQIHYLAQHYGGAAKPSGAGGGDICLALLPDLEKPKFKEAVSRLGFSILSL